jgi:tRNA(adenine34) deaminase
MPKLNMAVRKPKSRTGRTPAKKRRWVAKVTTDSTHPPEGLFTKNASTIARSLASKKVSPKGPASGLRMLTYFINRGGKGLSADRRAELEKAKALLSNRIRSKKTSSRRAA